MAHKMKKILSTIILISLLQACSFRGNTEGDWRCPAPDGKGCTSIQEADGLESPTGSTGPFNVMAVSEKFLNNFSSKSDKGGASHDGIPSRSKEILARIVFPAHVNPDGNYTDIRTIFAVMRESSWLGTVKVPIIRKSSLKKMPKVIRKKRDSHGKK
jgi:hypothetical protein